MSISHRPFSVRSVSIALKVTVDFSAEISVAPRCVEPIIEGMTNARNNKSVTKKIEMTILISFTRVLAILQI